MKKKLTTAAVAASMMGGIAIGSFAAPPMSAFAADTSTSATASATARTPGQWITDSLKGLVDNGTITQTQSDTIASTLQAAQPKGGHGGMGGGMSATAAASVLGMSESDLRTEMQTKSLADIAKEKNVDVQKVIDAIVAAENKFIDQQVTDGKLTQDEANTRKANVTTRVTADVNQVHADRGPRPPMDNSSTGSPSSTSSSTTTAPAA